MSLSFDDCYRALASRDARFDGRFFAGVTSTGIYCRPICPARKPAPRNVRLFANAAAAELAGFRACKRCRPDRAPGAEPGASEPALVRRALRLVDAGFLDGAGVDALAAELGVGARHLNRLLRRHVGCGAVALAQSRRAHFARQLLERTALPATDVAFRAGYASVRRFNAAIRARFGASPSELRNGRATAADALELSLAYREPFAWAELLAFLRARAVPGVERVDDASYARTFDVDGERGTLRVTNVAGEARIAVRVEPASVKRVDRLAARVADLFDLRADPSAIAAHLARFDELGPAVAAHPGLRVPGAWDGFETTVRAIFGQQVSVAGATTLAGALVERFGERLASGEQLFPTPAALVDATATQLRVPRARAAAIRALARAVESGALDLAPTADPERACATLAALPGIGPWTVGYVAMRVLRDPDALPENDLVLRRAAPHADPRAWSPWRAYAALYLWTGSSPAPTPCSSPPSRSTRSSSTRRSARSRSSRTGAR